MKKSFMMAVCAVLLTACTTKEEVVPESQGVTFYPALTRANETDFEEGDKISVFAVKASGDITLKPAGNYANNVCYVYKNGVFSVSPDDAAKVITLPTDGTGLAYYAVYPYQYALYDKGTFPVKVDQQSHTNITASDFCTVKTAPSNDKNVYLKFWHRLSRITVNIKNVPSGMQVTMRLKNMLYNAAFDLNANTYVATGGKETILMGKMEPSNRDFEAILPPQVFNLATDLIVNVGGTDYNVTTSRSADTFRSGMQYDYHLIYDGGIYPDEVMFKGYIHPWNTTDQPVISGEDGGGVVSEETEDSLRRYMPIYPGNNPPIIEGCYYIAPFETVYCQDGGYAPGRVINSYYCLFQNQNISENTIDYDGMHESVSQTEHCDGAYIRGSGNNFTAFFNTTGESQGISTKTALVISGTKTSDGIKDLYYAFVMVEKGDDPNHSLMDEGIFRVFRDQDALSVIATWPGEAKEFRSEVKGLEAPWTIYSRKD